MANLFRIICRDGYPDTLVKNPRYKQRRERERSGGREENSNVLPAMSEGMLRRVRDLLLDG